MSAEHAFALGGMTFEAVHCTDPSSGEGQFWVYRTDITPRTTVATGQPDHLTLTPSYRHWEDELGVLEQAVMDSMQDGFTGRLNAPGAA